MQKRMETLYNECVETFSTNKFNNDDLAKLVELVVLKCVELCKEDPYNEDAQAGIRQCVNRMKVHFRLNIKDD